MWNRFYHGPRRLAPWKVVLTFQINRQEQTCLQALWSSKDIYTLKGVAMGPWQVGPCSLFIGILYQPKDYKTIFFVCPGKALKGRQLLIIWSPLVVIQSWECLQETLCGWMISVPSGSHIVSVRVWPFSEGLLCRKYFVKQIHFTVYRVSLYGWTAFHPGEPRVRCLFNREMLCVLFGQEMKENICQFSWSWEIGFFVMITFKNVKKAVFSWNLRLYSIKTYIIGVCPMIVFTNILWIKNALCVNPFFSISPIDCFHKHSLE